MVKDESKQNRIVLFGAGVFTIIILINAFMIQPVTNPQAETSSTKETGKEKVLYSAETSDVFDVYLVNVIEQKYGITWVVIGFENSDESTKIAYLSRDHDEYFQEFLNEFKSGGSHNVILQAQVDSRQLSKESSPTQTIVVFPPKTSHAH